MIYPEDNEEYYVFLTPEATLALQKYIEKRRFDGEKLSEESPLSEMRIRKQKDGWTLDQLIYLVFMVHLPDF